MGNGQIGHPLPGGQNEGLTRLKTLPSRNFVEGGKYLYQEIADVFSVT